MDPNELTILDPMNNEGYGTARLPCPRDGEIASLVGQIEGPKDFADVKNALEPRHGEVLSAFAERMASFGVRTGSMDPLQHGLVAVQLAFAVIGDHRDSQPVLSLLFRACELLSVDPAAEFAAAAAVADSSDSLPVRDFLTREANERSITAMGYVESQDDEGFRFERTW